MANKKRNSEAASTPEQQTRAASSSRKKQRKTYVSKTVKIVLVVIGVLAMLLGIWLKAEDRKKKYGLELPNIKK